MDITTSLPNPTKILDSHENLPPTPSKCKDPVHAEFNLKLNIVIQLVGSRGDIQVSIALGNELQKSGHRVRITTHNEFADLVRQSGLEFFPLGLSSRGIVADYIQNQKGGLEFATSQIDNHPVKRASYAEMLDNSWRSCIDNDPLTNVPFVADAIIAVPVDFAHVHCAEALGVSVHMLWTMPWSRKRALRPVGESSSSGKVDVPRSFYCGVVGFIQSIKAGGILNQWRVSLGLAPIPKIQVPEILEALNVPFTFCWSPTVLPKPSDWPAHLDVSGYIFREPPTYTPPPELQEFLNAGPTPIYIGFGSMIFPNPARLAGTVHKAVAATGVRAIISRGWGGLQGQSDENIFYIDDCPHEWLFKHVSVVVHHGGAGTTACGLANGRPTAIVPFMADQPFWGDIIAAAGAGPAPISYTKATAENLATAIQYCLTDKAKDCAHRLAVKINSESGLQAAVEGFHRNLPLDRMRCSIFPNQPAAWIYQHGNRSYRFSKYAAQILLDECKIKQSNLELNAVHPYTRSPRWGCRAIWITLGQVIDYTRLIFLAIREEYRRGRMLKWPPGEAVLGAVQGLGKLVCFIVAGLFSVILDFFASRLIGSQNALVSAFKVKTRTDIFNARLRETRYLVGNQGVTADEKVYVVQRFNMLMRNSRGYADEKTGNGFM